MTELRGNHAYDINQTCAERLDILLKLPRVHCESLSSFRLSTKFRLFKGSQTSSRLCLKAEVNQESENGEMVK